MAWLELHAETNHSLSCSLGTPDLKESCLVTERLGGPFDGMSTFMGEQVISAPRFSLKGTTSNPISQVQLPPQGIFQSPVLAYHRGVGYL